MRQTNPDSPTIAVLSRRRFLFATFAAAGVGVLGYAFRIEPEWLQVVDRSLAIRNLPSRLEGRSLVQISDVHVGKRVSDEYVVRTFDTIRRLEPDIVAYTGDFTSFEPQIIEHAHRVYSLGPRGRLATVGILGNHDYGQDWAHPRVADELADTLKEVGIDVLRNQIRDVEGLQIIGMDDLWGGRFDPEGALRLLEGSKAAIVLSHNPDTADLSGWAGYQGWILSGHTHGGQCKSPFLPPPILPVKNRRYTSGEFDLGDGRHMYISRGVGHLTKVRFNVRPEVTRFTMHRA